MARDLDRFLDARHLHVLVDLEIQDLVLGARGVERGEAAWQVLVRDLPHAFADVDEELALVVDAEADLVRSSEASARCRRAARWP